MSKLNEYQLIQQHLSKDEKCFIDVQNYGQLMAGVQANKTYVNKGLTQSAIDNKFDGLEQYLHNLVSKGINNLQVFLRRKHGTGQKLIAALPLRIDTVQEETETPADAPMENAPVNYPQYPQALNNAYQSQAPAQKTYDAVPISIREELAIYREKLAETKQDRNKYKSKAEKFKERLDDAESQLKVAEKEKATELRMQEIELNSQIKNLKSDYEDQLKELKYKHRDEIRDLKESQKSFVDTEVGGLAISEGVGLIKSLASSRLGQQQPLAAPVEQFSQTKTVLLNSIKNSEFNDKNAEAVLFFMEALASKGKPFIEDYEALLIKHKLIQVNNESIN